MNYVNHYQLLMQRAKSRRLEGYKERHHIIPKCMGGDNSDSNLADLTPEEHFVAHQLLVKIYPSEKKLVYALSALCMSKNGIRNNKMFGWIKRRNSEVRRTKIQTPESNHRRSMTLRGRKTSTGMLGKAHSVESKLKTSYSNLGKMKDSPRCVYAWLKSPSHEEILFGPVLHECKKYHLVRDYITDLITGKKTEYKGWTFMRLATNSERHDKIEILRIQGLMF